MSGKIEISRELAERLDSPHSSVRNAAIESLRRILAAPVVERHPVACAHEWTDDGEFTLVCTKCGLEENYEPYGWVQTKGNAINHFTQEWDVVQDWEDKGFEYKPLFDTPPELAELQATIAQLRIDLSNQTELTNQANHHKAQRGQAIDELTAENERLLSGFWQQVTDADLKKIADFVGDGDLPTNSFFMRKDAGDLANMTMHMVREVQSLRNEIERLKGGQGEPIYQVQYRGDGGGGWSDAEKASYDAKVPHPDHWMTRIVYASQPAPVSVVLPPYMPGDTEDSDVLTDCRNEGWNACLDKLKELNQ